MLLRQWREGIGYLLIKGTQGHASLGIMRPEEMTLLFLMAILVR